MDIIWSEVSDAISTVICEPLERVQFVCQTQPLSLRIQKDRTAESAKIVDAFRRIYAKEDVSAFWWGTSVRLWRMAPSKFVKFTMKKADAAVKRRYDPSVDREKLFLATSVIGLCGALLKTVIQYPLDRVYARCVVDLGVSLQESPDHCSCPHVLGVLYVGIGRILWCDVLTFAWSSFGRGIKHVVDEETKSKTKRDSAMTDFLSTMLIAQVAGLFTTLIAYPFIPTRHRLMLQSGLPLDQQLYKGPIHCLQIMLVEEGVVTIFKGFGVEALKVSLSTTASVCFKYAKRRFVKRGPWSREELAHIFDLGNETHERNEQKDGQ